MKSEQRRLLEPIWDDTVYRHGQQCDAAWEKSQAQEIDLDELAGQMVDGLATIFGHKEKPKPADPVTEFFFGDKP